MDEVSIEEKVKIASSFVLASPPGEVNDVFNDVRLLVDNDSALEDGILQALEQYHIDQFATVTLPDSESLVIVSKYGKVGENRYLDPQSKQTFKLDSLRLAASDVEPHDGDQPAEELRSAIQTEALAYVEDHFPNGACAVYAIDSTHIVIVIVDNKYNPHNYWNGRWRATWELDTESGELKGTTKVQVHYYEDGNVQLNSDKECTLNVSCSTENAKEYATSMLKEIAKFDKTHQSAMNESYDDLAENTFKGLRRALPLTRNKLDWNKILNYKIGNELSQK
ncbi:F-actin-capping protein subunit alpha [Radiomyces spectabilis]|uniref:F-actin-capping protein subunit alpha n=1 Tax=Radiomyces spectabilis TaxID=64574 RepID=UPI00221E92D3|nr:F-actin-capping protein subunit alpha [Radiomyces spectabilis]KAI8391066.1 F-actin-capping protein subunit alpha [Radiomyces spectabilis]